MEDVIINKRNFLRGQEAAIVNMYESGNSSIAIAKHYQCSVNSIKRFLNKNNVQLRSNKINSKKNFCDEKYFETIDTDEKAYWLGFIFADGYVSKIESPKLGISLSNKDRDHLVKFKEAISFTGEIKDYIVTSGYKPGVTYSRIIMTSEKIVDDLFRYNLIEKKSLILDRPQNLDPAFYFSFIRGYFDGDGCITTGTPTKNAKHYSINITGTENLLLFIKEQIELNNIAVINKFYQRKKESPALNIKFGGNKQVLKFFHYAYDDATVYLERKYKIFAEVQKQAVELSRNTKC